MSQSKYSCVSCNQGYAPNNSQSYVASRSLVVNPNFGKDWLTTTFGTGAMSFTPFDLIKGVIHGGICYTLLAYKKPKKNRKELTTLAMQSFVLGAGIDQTIDHALHQAYNTTICGGTEAQPIFLEHALFQAILLQGGISALTAVGIKMLADRRKRR
ncbi:hypothetical protein MUP77_21725 [Candidatus Bathyarchaeota archaeon]|nr:hypothetical protein [Candidatus Bathyarchaeota archaeon]